MTLTVELPDIKEAALRAKAHSQGMSAEEYASQVLVHDLEDVAVVAARHRKGIETAREFVEWAKSHPDTPPLSDEAVSRASLNPDRW